MALLSSLSEETIHKVFAYGPSGTGKTVFATSFPGPVRHWDFDRKVASAVAHWRHKEPARLGQIDSQEYHPDDPMQFSKWYTDLMLLTQEGREGKLAFKTVVLDSITLWAEALLKEIQRQNPGLKSPIPTAPDVPGLQHYQIFSVRFREMMNLILSLPCNVVITGHLETEKDESTGRIMAKPLLPGKKNGEYLPVIFGEVYRTACEEVADKRSSYVAYTKATDTYAARTQIQGMPTKIALSYASLVQK
jgi:hypothetical protein